MRSKTAAEASSEADHPGALEDSQEVRARRRRNEAIRHQEFAQLRQLRQNASSTESSPQLARDENLLSMLGQETRSAETLQKIDAIEAQMSNQWWHQRAAKTPAQPAAAPAPAAQAAPVQTPAPAPAAQEAAAEPVHASMGADTVELEKQPADSPQPAAAPAQPVMRAYVPHPDVEEAAILFAHGDMDGARARLLELLLQALNTAPVDEEKVAVLWHAVLDLCRATGDEEAFEPLAIDYAEHFGRSAPLWVSIPERLGMPPLCGSARPKVSKRRFQWMAPSTLSISSVAALRASKDGAEQPWCLSWTRLNAIEEAALTPLTRLFEEWASSPGQFVFSDAGKLLQLLQVHTVVSDTSRSPAWWALRMATLRLLGRMDDYEQVALDYCITYEVSPPSWAEPRCQCIVQEEGDADVSLLHEASSQHSTQGQGHAQGGPVVMDRSQGLAGVIEGDPQEWLDLLGARAHPGQVLEVSCENLIRMDFVAASSVLNWAAELQGKGVILRFSKLNQLVAAFFHVIGIHEHATVQATLA